MTWTDFSKRVVAGAIAPVLVVSMAPAVALAADETTDVAPSSLAAATLEVQAADGGTFTFADGGISASDDASGYKISVDEDTGAQVLTITKAGTYTITGSCANGYVEVKKGVSDVNLVLNNLTLSADANKAIKFKAGSSGTIEIQGVNTLSTTNDKGIIKANAEADDSDNIVYAADGTTTGGDLVIYGDGTLNLSSTYSAVVDGETEDCDAINCEGDLTVLSGTFNIAVTDDAMHADNTLTIGSEDTVGPTINVTNSTEGLEGATVNLISGAGNIVSSDDGVNAANADLESYSWPYAINISGGTWMVNAEGDGLDSNGDIAITGGATTVYGSTSGGNGVFDIGDGNGYAFTVSGGTLWGLGTSDMAITPTSGSYVVFGGMGMGQGGMQPGQGGIQPGGGFRPQAADGEEAEAVEVAEGEATGDLSTQAMPGQQSGGSAVNITAGQTVTIADASGNEVASTTAAKNAQWVLYASSDLQSDASYTLLVNGTQAASSAAGAGGGQSGMQPGQPGDGQQPPDGSQPGRPGDGQQPPEGGQPGQPSDGQQPPEGQPGQPGESQQPPEGEGGQVNADPASGTVMFRLYNPNSGEHFYTASADERDGLVKLGWNFEGTGWTAPFENGSPVFRLYNANAGDHHYTTSEEERDMLVAAGWNYEGIGWYSADEQGTPRPNKAATARPSAASLAGVAVPCRLT